MEVSFPGGKKVDVALEGFVVHSDQPPEAGGEGSAPRPFNLFLASLATCAGYYVLAFCQGRNVPTEELRVVQRTISNPDGKGLGRIEIEVILPPEFPEKYVSAVVRAADACAVKKTILNPPEMVVSARRA